MAKNCSKELMGEKVHSIKAALAILNKCGAGMSRQAFHQSILEHLIASGAARKIGGTPGEKSGGVWEFDVASLQHWGRYIEEVRRRRREGKPPGGYEFSEFDMQCHADGAWDE